MKKKSNKKIIILLGLCAVIVLGVLAFFIVKSNRDSDSAFSPNLDPNTVNIGEEKENDFNEPEGIRIPGYPTITIPSGQTEVSMNLMNPEGNPCYFTFELVLTEENETIYLSQMVEPGKAITDVTLTRALDKGEYPAVLKITTASLSDGTAMNGANVETILVVE